MKAAYVSNQHLDGYCPSALPVNNHKVSLLYPSDPPFVMLLEKCCLAETTACHTDQY